MRGVIVFVDTVALIPAVAAAPDTRSVQLKGRVLSLLRLPLFRIIVVIIWVDFSRRARQFESVSVADLSRSHPIMREHSQRTKPFIENPTYF